MVRSAGVGSVRYSPLSPGKRVRLLQLARLLLDQLFLNEGFHQAERTV